jgi:hypothetical protein
MLCIEEDVPPFGNKKAPAGGAFLIHWRHYLITTVCEMIVPPMFRRIK